MNDEDKKRRAEIEAQPCRAAIDFTIETAETVDGERRIRGYANTFGVMRSGRIIHPQAVEDWLAANADARLPLLALHGFVGGFATIGLVEKLKVQRSKGLYFEATVASGLELADQAWQLVSQKMLSSLSLGWAAKQRRWVRADDKDLDPWFAKKLKEAGVTEALAFIDVEIVEISLVDVGDDRGAQLAASVRAELSAVSDQLSALKEELGGQLHRLEAGATPEPRTPNPEPLIEAAVNAARKAVEGMMTDFAHGLDERLCEVIEAKLADLQAAYLDDDFGDGADDAENPDETDGDAAAPSEAARESGASAELLERIRSLPVPGQAS